MRKLQWWGRAISPYDDVIDGRMILDRIDEIELGHIDDEAEFRPDTMSCEDSVEHGVLCELRNGIGERHCRDGVTLIRESYFRDHIKQEYEDAGSEYYEYNPNTCRHELVPWSDLMQRLPFSHIDWEAVAQAEQYGYLSLEFKGTTYYYREP